MHEFLYGVQPFAAGLTVKILNNILSGQINSDSRLSNVLYSDNRLNNLLGKIYLDDRLNSALSEEALDFMNRLLTLSPEKRLGYGGVEEVKNHGFFTGIDWNRVAGL